MDYFHDPAAPAANSLVVGTSAVVTDGEGRILLHRRPIPGSDPNFVKVWAAVSSGR